MFCFNYSVMKKYQIFQPLPLTLPSPLGSRVAAPPTWLFLGPPPVMTSPPGGPRSHPCLELGARAWGPLPVPNLVGDGEPQVEAGVLSDKATPGGGAGSPQPGDPPNLPVTIRQFQVKPQEERTDIRGHWGACPPAGHLGRERERLQAGWQAAGVLATW